MDGDEAVAAFFGMPERQKGIEVLLATKWQGMELHYGQLCNKLEDESEKLAAKLKKVWRRFHSKRNGRCYRT